MCESVKHPKHNGVSHLPFFLIQQKDHEEECVEPYLEYHVRYTDNNYVFEQWHPCLSGNKYFQNTNDSVRLMKPKMNKSIFLGHGSVR